MIKTPLIVTVLSTELSRRKNNEKKTIRKNKEQYQKVGVLSILIK